MRKTKPAYFIPLHQMKSGAMRKDLRLERMDKESKERLIKFLIVAICLIGGAVALYYMN